MPAEERPNSYAVLKQVIRDSKDIVRQGYEVSHQLASARKACEHGHLVAADAHLVEAIALLQMLLNRVSKLLRVAEVEVDAAFQHN